MLKFNPAESSCGVSQRRRSTNSSRRMAICPAGPPKLTQPNRAKKRRASFQSGTALSWQGSGIFLSFPDESHHVMAELENKYSENVAGKFFVDDQCIDCDLCRETAPANFTRSDDGGYSYVYKQPGTPEEEAQCKEAMEGCPVEAIGDNGG